MTREEAIRTLRKVQREVVRGSYIDEVYEMAIDALKHERTDEWCTDCKEYDTEKKCCPRFNRVIRGAMKREPSEDGTLEVKVEDATKVGRVLISDDKHRGGLYYPDEDEPQGVSFENDTEIKSYSKDSDLISREAAKDIAFRSPFFSDALMEELDALPSADRPTDGDLISRAEAIEAIEIVDWYHQNQNKDMVHGANNAEHQAWYKAQDIYKALEAVPSADRPRGEWINTAPSDRSDNIICDQCGYNSIARYDYCPHCGADMRGEENE